MKGLLSRRVRILGRAIPIWIVLTLILGSIGFAAITNIISNILTGSIEVKQALESRFLEVSGGLYINENGTISGSVYNGETFWYKLQTENKANVAIDRYPITEIISDQGISEGVQEIEYVKYYDNNYPDGIIITNLLYCVGTGGTLTQLRNCPSKQANEPLKIFFDNNGDGNPQPYTIGAWQTLWQKIEIKLSAATSPQTVIIKYYEIYDISKA